MKNNFLRESLNSWPPKTGPIKLGPYSKKQKTIRITKSKEKKKNKPIKQLNELNEKIS